MSRWVAWSVRRALINSGGAKNCNRCVFTVNMPGRSFGNGSEFDNFGWSSTRMTMRVMMSTASSSSPREEAKAVTEKDDRKQKSTSVPKAKEDESKAVVSSYWGIARPKLTKEDGTEWPWNCFMVNFYFLFFFFLFLL